MTTKKTEEGKKAPVFTLDQFVRRSGVDLGTVASFKYEAKKAGDDLTPRSKDAWHKAIDAQKKKKY